MSKEATEGQTVGCCPGIHGRCRCAVWGCLPMTSLALVLAFVTSCSPNGNVVFSTMLLSASLLLALNSALL